MFPPVSAWLQLALSEQPGAVSPSWTERRPVAALMRRSYQPGPAIKLANRSGVRLPQYRPQYSTLVEESTVLKHLLQLAGRDGEHLPEGAAGVRGAQCGGAGRAGGGLPHCRGHHRGQPGDPHQRELRRSVKIRPPIVLSCARCPGEFWQSRRLADPAQPELRELLQFLVLAASLKAATARPTQLKGYSNTTSYRTNNTPI